MSERITLNLDRDELTGAFQVSINVIGESGAGHGYRLLGPKYSGHSKEVAKTRLTERDADQIRRYLDRIA